MVIDTAVSLESFRSIDYAEMMARLRPRLPDLLRVVTVGGVWTSPTRRSWQ
jgi:hypothetical protein